MLVNCAGFRDANSSPFIVQARVLHSWYKTTLSVLFFLQNSTITCRQARSGRQGRVAAAATAAGRARQRQATDVVRRDVTSERRRPGEDCEQTQRGATTRTVGSVGDAQDGECTSCERIKRCLVISCCVE